MFENIGMWEILVLVVAGLFILGPDRLPEAARWLGSAVRQVKDYATGAQNHLKKELGPEFDQIRQPLDDLRSLRSLNPRRAITRSLFSDDDPVKPNGFAPGAAGSNGSEAAAGGVAATGAAGAAASAPAPAPRPPQQPLSSGEQPPVDPDAT
ncbi:Twin-arginine translocation protein TatB [Pseudonocardia sp. Ae168_Ps1]|uniref:Sec-independent protein translocase protein TatB n=1 Tax=unclassified Pseudonocardia TaxID=2619320 RepID=UPI00094B2554|nr:MULTISPECIES: Sec-independent protein translocase protein TatB [unclassified Pseudonocardia]OLL75782.1 Twin-arginine translocation protein TatB [Pseudonocardia sp. Ae150A_Ps1]OLL81782.1 Twin-arginine translocation protein TatB [Pseudonocardia sp. Ae168_Ps1]OLL84108.1 Twin-arginine translocation protein TatB [Pseudonocardia sp. Ae263_Ps1]OLL95874.1 Twin-arginine translocation protein TatB [Pseudonocardia sp. Ae356_Ps1]